MLLVKTEKPAVCAATGIWWRHRNAGIENIKGKKNMQTKIMVYVLRFIPHAPCECGLAGCFQMRFFLSIVHQIAHPGMVKVPHPEPATFVAQQNFSLDRFITSHQMQAGYSSETVSCTLGKYPGMWLCPRCTHLNRRKEKISVVTNYLDFQVC